MPDGKDSGDVSVGSSVLPAFRKFENKLIVIAAQRSIRMYQSSSRLQPQMNSTGLQHLIVQRYDGRCVQQPNFAWQNVAGAELRS